MEAPALLLTIAVLLPLVGFLVLVFVGKRHGHRPLAGIVGTAFIAGQFPVQPGDAVFPGSPAIRQACGASAIVPSYLPWIPLGTFAGSPSARTRPIIPAVSTSASISTA